MVSANILVLSSEVRLLPAQATKHLRARARGRFTVRLRYCTLRTMVGEFTRVPFPSWPRLLSPQQ